jgi:hypothetical protein
MLQIALKIGEEFFRNLAGLVHEKIVKFADFYTRDYA